MGYRFDISKKKKKKKKNLNPEESEQKSAKIKVREWKSDKIKSAENHSDVKIDRQKPRSLKTTLAMSTNPTSKLNTISVPLLFGIVNN